MKIEIGDSKIEIEGNHWLWVVCILLCFGWKPLLGFVLIFGGFLLYKDERVREKVLGWLSAIHGKTTKPLTNRIRKKFGIQ